MPPVSGPCSPWIDRDDVDVTYCEEPSHRQAGADFASAVLFRLSGRQFPGICTRTVRPCNGNGCASGGTWPASWSFPAWEVGHTTPTIPVRHGDGWANIGGCSGRCNLPTVTLPGPIHSITQVVIDGAVLPSSAYRLERHRQLARIDGGVWPCWNDLAANSGLGGAPGTWQVTYQFGRLPGPDGIIAVKRFAGEIARYLCDPHDEHCRLPQRIRSIVREGVTVDMADPLTFLDRGEVGIYEVDLWLNSLNPKKLQRRASIRRLDQ